MEWNVVDEDGFLRVMEDVNSELTEQSVPIPNRPMWTIGVIARRYGLLLMLTGGRGVEPRPGCYAGDDLVERIFRWFDARYGEKLKKDFSVGVSVVMVRGDPYRVKIPFIVGTVKFVCDKYSHGNGSGGNRIGSGPCCCNILDLIDGLQQNLTQVMTEGELIEVAELCRMSMESMFKIEKVLGLELCKAGRSDLVSSVDEIMRERPECGASMYHSLQAVEKFFKAFLTARGVRFPVGRDGHSLHKLAALAEENGLAIDKAQLDLLPYASGLRYREVVPSLKEAYDAHRAAIVLCGDIAEAMGGGGFFMHPS